MEKKILLFTLAIDTSDGKFYNSSNFQKDDLPLLHRALRIVEDQLLDNILNPVPDVIDSQLEEVTDGKGETENKNQGKKQREVHQVS